MSESKVFHKNLQILRNRVKQRRKQELYDMMNEGNNSIEDKIALIKMSFNELDGKLQQASQDDHVKVIILSSTGKVFCAGHNLKD